MTATRMTSKQKMTKTKRTRATVFDVAKLAGVSIATVSRTLNSPDGVRQDLRDRVQAAAIQLDYFTDSVGKALRSKRTHIIGTMIPKLADPLFSVLASAIQETLEPKGYVGFVHMTGFDNSSLFDGARRLIERGCEGLIVFGRIDDQRLIDYAASHEFPLISAYSYSPEAGAPTVGFDNYNATEQLVTLLQDLGHRHIAMISGQPKGNDRQEARISAFNEVQSRLGVPPVIEFVEMDGDELPSGSAAFLRIMQQHPETTAIVCNRDVFAFGVIAEARKLGIRVPEDLSLTGFDDIDYAALIDPALTTVGVPAARIGAAAAAAMIRHLDAGAALQNIRFETEVILRKSVSRPRTV